MFRYIKHPIQVTLYNQARTIDCTYLQPETCYQGGHELLHITTNREIICRRVTELPISDNILHRIVTIARKENLPKGFKSKLKNDFLLRDEILMRIHVSKIYGTCLYELNIHT